MFVGDQKRLERIQRRATRLVAEIRHLPYQDRLIILHLPSLVYRRRRGDMLMVYRILTGKTEMDTFFQTTVGEQRTRGHQMKLRKPMAVKTV